MVGQMDTLGIEPRASRMLSGCDTTTPCALEEVRGAILQTRARRCPSSLAGACEGCPGKSPRARLLKTLLAADEFTR